MGTSGRRLTPAEEGELIRLRCLGWSVRKVAREMGLCRKTVWTYAPKWLVDEWNNSVVGSKPLAPPPALPLNLPQDSFPIPDGAR